MKRTKLNMLLPLLGLLLLTTACVKEEQPRNDYVITLDQRIIDYYGDLLEERESVRLKRVQLVEQDDASGRYVFKRSDNQKDLLVLTRNDQGVFQGDLLFWIGRVILPGQIGPMHLSNVNMTADGAFLRFDGDFLYHWEGDKQQWGEPIEHKEYDITGPFHIVPYDAYKPVYTVKLDGIIKDNYKEEQKPYKHQFRNVVMYDTNENTGELWFRNADFEYTLVPNADALTLVVKDDGTFSGLMYLNHFPGAGGYTASVEGKTKISFGKTVYEGTFLIEEDDLATPLGWTGTPVYHYEGTGTFVAKPR